VTYRTTGGARRLAGAVPPARRDGHHVLRDDYIPADQLAVLGFGPADLADLTELTGLDGRPCYDIGDVCSWLGRGEVRDEHR
jgi:hypothetical protein